MKTRRIQDCVHGLMEFKGSQNSILDALIAPEIQRLRNIKQLGLAHFVFPGAEHSRFAHSLGVAHLALKFTKQLSESSTRVLIKELRPSDLEMRDMAIAGLCHDLGHGPFSHAWEREIICNENGDFNEDDWIKSLGLEDERGFLKKRIDWHELVGYSLLAWKEGPLHSNLEQREVGSSQRIRRLLMGDYHLSYLPRLMSSDIDADRSDYILRDSLLSGVKYGRYDIDWLISTCKIGKNEGGEYVVGFDINKSLRVVEQFLLSRRALYEILYTHKSVSAAEGMISCFFKRLKKVVQEGSLDIKGIEHLKPIIEMIKGKAVGQKDLLLLNDNTIWTIIERISTMKDGDEVLFRLSNMLVRRQIFKLVNCNSKKLMNKMHSDPKLHEKIKEIVETYVGTGNGDYFIRIVSRPLSLLSEINDERNGAYFIYPSGNAELISKHDEFRGFLGDLKHIYRVYTVPEAVDKLEKLLN